MPRQNPINSYIPKFSSLTGASMIILKSFWNHSELNSLRKDSLKFLPTSWLFYGIWLCSQAKDELENPHTLWITILFNLTDFHPCSYQVLETTFLILFAFLFLFICLF